MNLPRLVDPHPNEKDDEVAIDPSGGAAVNDGGHG
jgi:hypothetical protein